MNILPVDFTEALFIAVEENITFYDSSYIQAASQNNLELVKDDLKLCSLKIYQGFKKPRHRIKYL